MALSALRETGKRNTAAVHVSYMTGLVGGNMVCGYIYIYIWLLDDCQRITVGSHREMNIAALFLRTNTEHNKRFRSLYLLSSYFHPLKRIDIGLSY